MRTSHILGLVVSFFVMASMAVWSYVAKCQNYQRLFSVRSKQFGVVGKFDRGDFRGRHQYQGTACVQTVDTFTSVSVTRLELIRARRFLQRLKNRTLIKKLSDGWRAFVSLRQKCWPFRRYNPVTTVRIASAGELHIAERSGCFHGKVKSR